MVVASYRKAREPSRDLQRSRRVDGAYPAEHANIAVDEHKQAAEQLDKARGLVGQALNEIDDVSRGMNDTIRGGMNDTIRDSKKLSSESELQEAVERAKATAAE